MPSKTCDLLVLGGGPAGVATALEAAERGMQVVLLERESTTGGMAGSFECDGVRVDFGSHRLHPVTPPEVMQRLTQLLGDDLQMRTRHGRLRLVDRWVHFPLQVRDLATAMPPG
ncbi:MAG: FAD-dependent oxidoreductase [Ornithinimicrobium sp.]